MLLILTVEKDLVAVVNKSLRLAGSDKNCNVPYIGSSRHIGPIGEQKLQNLKLKFRNYTKIDAYSFKPKLTLFFVPGFGALLFSTILWVGPLRSSCTKHWYWSCIFIWCQCKTAGTNILWKRLGGTGRSVVKAYWSQKLGATASFCTAKGLSVTSRPINTC